MQRFAAASLATFLVLLSLLPSGEAHAAPPAPEYYKRQLHDCNDDWGGHALAHDGHDLISADATERYIGSAGDDLLVVYLSMSGGYAGANSQKPLLKETLQISVGTRTVSATITSTDNKVFTATGADYLRQPKPILDENGDPDGSRVSVEVGFTYARLGANIGDVVRVARIDGYAGESRADYLAGGYYLSGQHVANCPLNGTAEEAYFVSSGYTLEGTAQKFFTATVDTTAVVAKPDDNVTKEISIASKLKNTEQTVNTTVSLPTGWAYHIQPSASQKLGGGATLNFQIHLLPGATAQSGPATVQFVSAEGGFHHVAIPLQVQGPTTAATSATGGPTTHASGTTEGGEGIPGLDAIVVLLGVGLLAVLRRR